MCQIFAIGIIGTGVAIIHGKVANLIGKLTKDTSTLDCFEKNILWMFKRGCAGLVSPGKR